MKIKQEDILRNLRPHAEHALHQQVAGRYLRLPLPQNWLTMDKEDKLDFIERNRRTYFSDRPSEVIFTWILSGMYDTVRTMATVLSRLTDDATAGLLRQQDEVKAHVWKCTKYCCGNRVISVGKPAPGLFMNRGHTCEWSVDTETDISDVYGFVVMEDK